MKKRLHGLLALWLAVLMMGSVFPVGVYAAEEETEKTVWLYTGTEELTEEKYWFDNSYAEKAISIPSTASTIADQAIQNNWLTVSSNQELIGWTMWAVNGSGFLDTMDGESPVTVTGSDEITEELYSKHCGNYYTDTGKYESAYPILVPVWAPKADQMEKYSAYQVLHYKETLNGTYEEVTADKQFPLYAKVGETVSAEEKTYIGYTLNKEKTVSSATLAEATVDGNNQLVLTTLAFYYDLNDYTLTFNTAGGSSVAPITQPYMSAVTTPENPRRDGYTFLTWVDANGNDATIPTTMPAENRTFTAKWVPKADQMEKYSAYQVLHYKETLNGTYEEVTADKQFPLYAKVGETVSAEEKTYIGYTLNKEKTVSSVTLAEATVDGNNQLVLTTLAFYYDLNTYTVKVNNGTGTGTYAPGAQVKITANAPETGKVFDKWVVDADNIQLDETQAETEFTMPAESVVITAIYKNAEQPRTNTSNLNLYWMLLALYNRTFEITSTAVEGGTITPEGVTKVLYNRNQTYTITPAEGYIIADVLVDCKSVGAVSEYTFKRVKKNHTISVIFEKTFDPIADLDNNPDAAVTRVDLLTALWQLDGSPIVESVADFFDVPADADYRDAAAWASANGISNGTGDGLFGADDVLTREQMATILYRYAQYKGGGFTGAWMFQLDYADAADISEGAYEAICWLTMNEIYVTREDGTLDPQAEATRADAAAFLRRFCEAEAGE